MPYTTIVAGTSILASWANASVRDQVVTPFATTSARSSAVSSTVEGMVSAITDDNRLEVYDGSAYQRFAHYASGGRTGGTWTRASNLSCNNGTETSITFTAETTDSDGFLTPTSGTVTIPSGLGGIYVFDLSITMASALSVGGFHYINIYKGGTMYAGNVLGTSSTTAKSGISGILVLSAADTIEFKVVQNSGAPLNLTAATLNFYRLAI